jgi:hypothetical protein
MNFSEVPRLNPKPVKITNIKNIMTKIKLVFFEKSLM